MRLLQAVHVLCHDRSIGLCCALFRGLYIASCLDLWLGFASNRSAWTEHLARLTELAQFLEAGGAESGPARPLAAIPAGQWGQFGRLLRDKRTAAGLNRVKLARRAKISDATIKFIETARYPPSRATLIRLIGVSDLKLRRPDVPGHPEPPAPEFPPVGEPPPLRGPLRCLLAPSYDPLSLHAEMVCLLQGAGGYLEQAHAYLEP